MNYLVIFSLLSVMYITIVESIKYLHILQLEGYKINQYTHWLTKNYVSKYKRHIIFFISSIFVYVITSLFDISIAFVAFLIATIVHNFITFIIDKPLKQKKIIVYTSRLKRVIFSLLFLELIEIGLVYYYLFNYSKLIELYTIFFTLIILLILYIPLNVLMANAFTLPIEKMIQNGYKAAAKKILENNSKIKVIGITGSFGKTSTKNFLYDILSAKYNVLKTPESFNTPMGLCRVIRGNLNESHDIFIAEMGARYVQDIKEICGFVKPHIGILTSIGPQHLETFGSIENVAKAKLELIKALPDNGFAVLNGDNDESLKFAHQIKVEKMIVGIENTNVDVFATHLEYNSEGTKFTVNIGDEKLFCQTKVLGMHSVYNILQSVCVAKHLGMTNDEIRRGIGNIKPVEHRLQIIPTNNGITVIDDAFNSNPVGSSMALDVISKFLGNKIIITPGMIELGENEYKYNKEFGVKIGKTCDVAILVGQKRSKPIVDGIHETSFPKDKIIVVNNLDEASQKVGLIAKTGDVLLFENDLPDNYNE